MTFKSAADYESFAAWYNEGSSIQQRMQAEAGLRTETPDHWRKYAESLQKQGKKTIDTVPPRFVFSDRELENQS